MIAAVILISDMAGVYSRKAEVGICASLSKEAYESSSRIGRGFPICLGTPKGAAQ